jgi:tetratricopeptide (TPR) repeat protein
MPSYRDPAGREADMTSTSGVRLLLMWSSQCSHCLAELGALSRAAERLRAAGLTVLALSVDALDYDHRANDAEEARDFIQRARVPFAWGFIDSASLGRAQLFQEALFDRAVPTTVPLMFLLDREGNAVTIYRGPLAVERLLEDVKSAIGADDEELHHLAPPLPGRWFTRPVAIADMAEFMARQFQARLPEDSLPYLHLAAERSSGDKQTALRRELTETCHALALEYQSRQDLEHAAFYFEAALSSSADSAEIHCDYAQLLGAYGVLKKARAHFERALALRPGFERARRGLELLQRLSEGSPETRN